jgi:c-di-GMP-binding flagellar brake protein YcgR
MNQTARIPVTESSRNTTIIREAARIRRLLNDLKDAKALVTVSVPGAGELFNSAILGVKAGPEGPVLLDELKPSHGHELLLGARRLQVQGRLEGLSVRFETELLSSGVAKGLAFYRVRLPEELEHDQKRQYYRVRVGLNLKLPVVVLDQADLTLDGELRDISVGGIGAAFTPGVPIESGMAIEACWIDLPGGESVSCGLKVRHTEVDTPHRELHVGASFVGLTPAQERVVQRCIHTLEREEIRRKTRA